MVVRLSGLEVCMSKGLVNWLIQYLTKKFATPLVAYPIQEMLAHLKMLFGNAPLNVCLWFPKYKTGFTISNLLNTYASFWPHTPFCWSSLNKWEKRKYLMAVSIGQSSWTHCCCLILLKSKRRNQSLPMDFVLLVMALVFGALNHGAIETARAFIFSKPPGVRTVSSKERLTYKTSQELQNNAKQCGS